jgi:diaminohydroxyphosphoribosylaminopyrimidine deaminase/5-amino-6-(5-phosphoribosylamino)uracil reductase
MNTDEFYMRMALSLARKAAGNVSPNPMVGAVVVKNGKVVGKGYHKRYGEAHGEVNALNDAGPKAKGATLYLNLEPCCHYGKTPPCTDAVIRSGVKRVVAGMVDPNPKVSGKGFEILRKAGIVVDSGILEEESKRLNEGFIKRVSIGRPFVILKVAASLDGKTATRSNESKWITSEASRRHVHKLRGQVDAIMTGIGTVLADDPFLTPRAGKVKRLPLRVVIDSSLKVPPSARIAESNTLFMTTEKAPEERIELLRSRGAEVDVLRSREGKVDLTLVMEHLGKRGVSCLMVEAGPELSASLLREGLIDKVLFFYAPKLIGGVEAPGMVGGEGIDRLSEAISLKEIKVKRLGEDVMIEGYV